MELARSQLAQIMYVFACVFMCDPFADLCGLSLIVLVVVNLSITIELYRSSASLRVCVFVMGSSWPRKCDAANISGSVCDSAKALPAPTSDDPVDRVYLIEQTVVCVCVY